LKNIVTYCITTSIDWFVLSGTMTEWSGGILAMENADDSDTESGMYWSAVVTYVFCLRPVLSVVSECNHFENRSF